MAVERLHISNEEYFKLPYASNSGLVEAHKLFQESENGQVDLTAAYRFGSAFDAIATDPNEYDSTDLTDPQVSILMPMRRALEKNSIYQAIFKNAASQVVFVDREFKVEINGLQITIPAKCKYDKWAFNLGFGGDIKSTQVTTQAQFAASVKFLNYDRQAAWYMDITGSERFPIIGVSKKNHKTFVVSIKRGDELYYTGRQKYQKLVPSWWKLNLHSTK